MSAEENSKAGNKRAKRRRCPKCGQVIMSNNLYDKCLYCGKELPEELRLSAEEKDKVRQAQREKASEKEEERRRQNIVGPRTQASRDAVDAVTYIGHITSFM